MASEVLSVTVLMWLLLMILIWSSPESMSASASMSCAELFDRVRLRHLKGRATIFADVFARLALASSELDSEVTEVVDREDRSEERDDFTKG
jgi:hypothetical protein